MRRTTLCVLSMITQFFTGIASLSARAEDSLTAAVFDDAWEEIDQSDGIEVYRRKVPDEGLFEFRGVGVVDVSIPKLVALMADADNLPLWMFGCIKGELLERNFNEDEYARASEEYYEILYGINSFPWPVNNRDYVVKAGIRFIPKGREDPFRVHVVTQNVSHPQKPAGGAYVRMPRLHTLFVLTPLAGSPNRTKVDLIIAADPGGYVPHWVTNLVSRILPYKTILSLRELAKTDGYNKKMEALVLYHYQRSIEASSSLSH